MCRFFLKKEIFAPFLKNIFLFVYICKFCFLVNPTLFLISNQGRHGCEATPARERRKEEERGGKRSQWMMLQERERWGRERCCLGYTGGRLHTQDRWEEKKIGFHSWSRDGASLSLSQGCQIFVASSQPRQETSAKFNSFFLKKMTSLLRVFCLQTQT